MLHIWMELIYLPEVVSASSFLVFKHNLEIKIAATHSLTHSPIVMIILSSSNALE